MTCRSLNAITLLVLVVLAAAAGAAKGQVQDAAPPTAKADHDHDHDHGDVQPMPPALEVIGRELGVLVEKAFENIGQQDREQRAQQDQQMKRFQQQHAKQLQQLRLTELHFIRVVCDPTKQEFQRIARDSEEVVATAVRKLARSNNQIRRIVNGRVAVEFEVGAAKSDPRELIADGLRQSVKKHLSREQEGRYRQELERRDVARKRVARLNIIAKLDKQLMLTAEQRGQMDEVLKAGWRDAWLHSQMLIMGTEYFPHLPVDKILPILNRAQKDAWRGIYKQGNVSASFGPNFGFVHGVELPEERWPEDEQRHPLRDDE